MERLQRMIAEQIALIAGPEARGERLDPEFIRIHSLTIVQLCTDMIHERQKRERLQVDQACADMIAATTYP